jgi:predicted nucleotidyltransferase
MLNLEQGAHIAITLDEDNPDKIYIRKADDADDNSETQTAKVYNHRLGTFKCRSRAVVEHVLSITEANTSVTLFVSPKPMVIEGKTYYRIIVESPLSIK